VAGPPTSNLVAGWPQSTQGSRVESGCVRRPGEGTEPGPSAGRLEIDHVEGRVINELVVRLPDTLELWEEKRRYDVRFSNRFEAVPGGARFTARGDIYLKSWARLLQPFLAGYVRRLQLQPVKAEAEARGRR
jgi:hypothetical protein